MIYFKITDNSGKEYVVKKPQRFFDHLIKYHSNNNVGDNSIHEENKCYFTVTEELFAKVKSFIIN
ncbi:hypothetical protein OAJ74_00120 [Alphaproteobacteria bacterium]|nr:hypothetical protein [Alphaproteobacteria bacterium]